MLILSFIVIHAGRGKCYTSDLIIDNKKKLIMVYVYVSLQKHEVLMFTI